MDSVDILRFIKEDYEAGKKLISVEGLYGSSKAFFLAALVKSTGKPLLAVCPSLTDAWELYRDLEFFLLPRRGAQLEGDASGGLFFFPPREVSPYDGIDPQKALVCQRFEVLRDLALGAYRIVITSAEALAEKYIPPAEMQSAVFDLSAGDALEMDRLVGFLIDCGYKRCDIVEGPGEFSIRGGIIDIFPPSRPYPFRMELFGDEIESMRDFDPASQKSMSRIDSATIAPAEEMILKEENIERFAQNLRSELKRKGIAEGLLDEELHRIYERRFFPGIGLFSPLLYGELRSIFDYMAPDAAIVLDEPDSLWPRIEELISSAEKKYSARLEEGPFCPEASQFYIDCGEVRKRLEHFRRIELSSAARTAAGGYHLKGIKPLSMVSYRGHFSWFTAQLNEWLKEGYRVVIISVNETEAERLQKLLKDYDLGASICPDFQSLKFGLIFDDGDGFAASGPSISICIGRLGAGFQFPFLRLAIVVESQIFGVKAKKLAGEKRKAAPFIFGLKELNAGDYVVHTDHGIGRYLGLASLEVEGRLGDFLEIEYQEGEKLYLPADKLNLIDRYSAGDGAAPRLDKLGGISWQRVKQRIKKAIQRMAKDLLKLYAFREITQGFSFSADTNWHREFAAAFEYEETEDQLKSIKEVEVDMEKLRPMDRLVCGDVGYGKTEVALRASFKAVYDGKQVAVLVPTTILAEQHYRTFKSRFANYPVNIDVMSRFRSKRQQADISERLSQGKIDIIIGTHRLLQKDITFKDLGLLIIDEEHKFGVAHKEKLKHYRNMVDVMALSATPIPRTLNLSLMGIRDFSVINSPPEDRLAVMTYIAKLDLAIIREAILKELKRGGQVFFVHNRIEGIDSMADFLARAVPEAKLDVAHGQMAERALEKVMISFLDRQIDLLVCTAIIESGLDIPSVNTIIINRADTFGLAQLYQLRGRVGRDRYQAYCYLLMPGDEAISETARKRLKAIAEMSELGSGFHLAARDLEIRGAGNILGTEQSGHIAAVGFDLYCKLIEEAIGELKGKKIEADFEPKLCLNINGYMPSTYITNTNQRLEIYRRLYSVADADQVKEIKTELVDRFGAIPEPVAKLLSTVEIRAMAKELRVDKVEVENGAAFFHFHKSTSVSPVEIIEFLAEKKGQAELIGEYTVKLRLKDVQWEAVVDALKGAMAELL